MRLPRWRFLYGCALVTCSGGPAVAVDLDPFGGTYYGLIHGVSFEDSGYFQVSVTRTGRATAAMKLGSGRRCVVAIEWDGSHFVTVPGGNADVQVSVAPLTDSRGNTVIVGDLTDDGVTVPVHAVKAAVTARHDAGRYTFIVGRPDAVDVACGSATVSGEGNVRAIVCAASGRTVSAGGRIGTDGNWPLFAALTRGTALSGEVSFGQAGDSDCRGKLSLSEATANLEAGLVGSRYFSARTPVLIVPPSAPNAVITIARAHGPGFTRRAILTDHNTFLVPNASTDKTALTLTGKSGVVNGRFFSAGGFRSLRGVVMQSRNRVEGFIVGERGGSFSVVPQSPPARSAPQIAATTGDEVDNGGSGTSTTDADVNTDVSETISGGFDKQGAGSLIISGGSEFTGNTTISGGTLQFDGGGISLAALGALGSGAVLGVLRPVDSLILTRPVEVIGSTPGGLSASTDALQPSGGTLTLLGPQLATGSSIQFLNSNAVSGGTLTPLNGSQLTLVNGDLTTTLPEGFVLRPDTHPVTVPDLTAGAEAAP